jgi:hypothetical protein
MKKETDNLRRFLELVIDYKNKIGFKGQILLEPKPHEPTKHQYDFDSASCLAFLRKAGLENEIKLKSWLIIKNDYDLIKIKNNLWSKIIKDIGGETAYFFMSPDYPGLN